MLSSYNYTVYNKNTGAYVKNLEMPNRENAELNVNEDEVLIDGEYNNTTCLKNNAVCKCPIRPQEGMAWDNVKGWHDPRTEDQINNDIQKQVHENRLQRNMLLTECDWTQMPDNALSEEARENWKHYRQELRDMTDFQNPVWPKKP